MQDGRFSDEFDRFYAESLSGGVRIQEANNGRQSGDMLDASALLEPILDAAEDDQANGSPQKPLSRNDSIGNSDAGIYKKNVNITIDQRRWSNASSVNSSRSRSSSGSSNRGLSIPERVAVTREGLVEQIIEKWRAAMEETQGSSPASRIIITDDENHSRYHDVTSSSSSSSGSRPRAHTFGGRAGKKSPSKPVGMYSNSDDPLVDPVDRDCLVSESDEFRQRAYSANNAAGIMAANALLDPERSVPHRASSGGQIFHFAVERRPSVAGRLLSFLGARQEPRRCEIAVRQMTPLEASNVPSSTEIKSMELLLIGQGGVGKKELVRSLLNAAAAPPVGGTELERTRLQSIDSEISWDEQTCIVSRCYLEVDQEVVNFTARCATNEEDCERCLMQSLPDVAIAVYSVADLTSVSTARTLMSYVAQRTPKRTALCLIANKADLSGVVSNSLGNTGSPLRREMSGGSVSRSAGRSAAKSVGASWLETSAVISLNIRTLLAALLQHWVHQNATTIMEEQAVKESSQRSSPNPSRSGSFRRTSRSNSLIVRQDNPTNPAVTTLTRVKSERSQRSHSPVPRAGSSKALISACHPILTALCISKGNAAPNDGDRNSNSNDSGVHDSPGISDGRQKDPKESVL